MKEEQLEDMIVGVTLYRLRTQKDLTQDMIGHCFRGGNKNQNQHKVSQVEKGKRSLGLSEFFRVTEFMGISLEEFKVEFLKNRMLLCKAYGVEPDASREQSVNGTEPEGTDNDD